MILGTLYIHPESGAVVTHRDSYLPENLTVVSVRRIALPVCGTVAIGLLGFTASFADLLYIHEIALTLLLVGICLFAGSQVGQLKLLSRDLRQSELSGVIYGRYRDLNSKRGEIIDAILKAKAGRGE
jgi:uncharacterized membrane protein YgdD (TMEM256/DUF423 family)